MITAEQLNSTVIWDGLKEFGSFVLSHTVDGNLPDYKKMDLMKIPHLVPHLWVYDLRLPENKYKFLVHFSGTKIDEFYEQKVMGKFDIDFHKNHEFYELIIENFSNAIDSTKTIYLRWFLNYQDEHNSKKNQNTEILMFPCSSDMENVNFAIGISYRTHGKPFKESANIHF